MTPYQPISFLSITFQSSFLFNWKHCKHYIIHNSFEKFAMKFSSKHGNHGKWELGYNFFSWNEKGFNLAW